MFNSFGQTEFGIPSAFGVEEPPPTNTTGPGFMHFSVDQRPGATIDQALAAMTPEQIASMASHAVEKYNTGIPLTEEEQKALAAYQAQMANAPVASESNAPAWLTPQTVLLGALVVAVLYSLSQQGK